MSNFLNNVAARARPGVPAIQPRPRARFEPPAPALPGTRQPGWGELPVEEAGPPSALESPAVARSFLEAGPAAGARAVHPGNEGPVSGLEPRRAGEGRSRSAARPGAAGEENAMGIRRSTEAGDARSDLYENTSPLPRREERGPAALPSVPRAGEGEAGQRAAVVPRSITASAPGRPEPAPRAGTESAAHAGVAPAGRGGFAAERGRPAAANPAAARREQARVVLPAGRVTAAPPVIQVSIGRVEVRAVTAATPARPAPAPAGGPRLTLEDYLHGRNEGRR